MCTSFRSLEELSSIIGSFAVRKIYQIVFDRELLKTCGKTHKLLDFLYNIGTDCIALAKHPPVDTGLRHKILKIAAESFITLADICVILGHRKKFQSVVTRVTSSEIS
jgi:hypothetical protein